MSKITIVMYHFVRDLVCSRYPEIKGLDVSFFREQLMYFMRYYDIVKMEDIIDAVNNKKELNDNSLLLTFDDGYKDHFEYVFPILDELGIQGSFFPPAKAIMEHKMLDVNKIHFVLASVKEKQQIILDIFSELSNFRKEYPLESNEYYFGKLAVESRFDTKEVIFIKRILQRELPENIRNSITSKLFHKYVYDNEDIFSRELYMNIDQIKCMKKNGMFIGTHGYNHNWLNTLTHEEQRIEIELSLCFLKKVGCDTRDWVMCYPYGAYNESLMALIKGYGCKLALTTNVAIGNLNRDDLFTLPRLDTNDFPTCRDEKPNKWSLSVIGSTN